MAPGALVGDWRMVKIMRMKIIKRKPVGGFCAESADVGTLFLAAHRGVPVPTASRVA